MRLKPIAPTVIKTLNRVGTSISDLINHSPENHVYYSMNNSEWPPFFNGINEFPINVRISLKNKTS